MRLKRYQFNGIQFISIVDEYDCPVDPYAACYINESLTAGAFNTTLRYANELLFLLYYFSDKSIDLTDRVSSGKFISRSEYSAFYGHCHFNKSLQLCSDIEIFPNIDDKNLRNAMAANLRGIAKVSPETIQGRIRRFRTYVEWLFDQFHGGKRVDEATQDYFHKLVCKIKLDENSFGRNQDFKPVVSAESVIPDEVFGKLLEMIIPESPNNPFKSSRVRNYLIVSVLIQTGIRRGALAKLKISDCRFYGGYDRIAIYRSGNDLTDPRLEKPSQKTRAHDVAVDQSLMKQIKVYIDHIRSQFSYSANHDFIFVSEKNSKGTLGWPISLKTVNNIFKKLSSALNFHVHPHLLRHKWNDIFDAAGEASNTERSLLEDMRRYAMGWSPNSTMAQAYNDKALQRKTTELMRQHQERLMD